MASSAPDGVWHQINRLWSQVHQIDYGLSGLDGLMFCNLRVPTTPLEDTLKEANALLDELEARDSRQAPQITVTGNGSKTQTYESNMDLTSVDRDRIEG